MLFFTYVIQSEHSGKIYIGQTDNLELRLRRHNGTLPAIVREKQLKSHHGRDWLRTIIS